MAILKFLNENHEWEQVDVVSDGVTFIPSIAEDGTLSWSNNGSLQNPDPVMLDSNSVVIRDTKEEFPVDGNINLLYLERTNNDFYRWDSVSRKYIKISSGGGGSVDISGKPGNILTYDDDHKLYVPAGGGAVEISEKDNNILTFDEDNKLYVPKEEIEISEDEGNAIEARDNGLYVPTVQSGGGSAEETTYDNTTSELEATNVQDAIDELAAKPSGGGSADQITYDNSQTSYFEVENVQDVLTELNTMKSNSNYYVINSPADGVHMIIKLYTPNGELLDSYEYRNYSPPAAGYWFTFHELKVNMWNGTTDVNPHNIIYVDDNSKGLFYNDTIYAPGQEIYNAQWSTSFTITVKEMAHIYSGAEFISYSNQDSELTATTVKDAIDELAAGGSSVNIIDNLTSDDSTAALSARQGAVLNNKFNDYLATANITVSNIDIGEGAELPTGHFYFVYED